MGVELKKGLKVIYEGTLCKNFKMSVTAMREPIEEEILLLHAAFH